MTLTRKRTRAITVDDIRYRWMLKETDYGDRFELLLIVEANDYPNGERLVAHLKADDRREQDVISPRLVATLITEARKLGWEPEYRGSCPPSDLLLLRLLRANQANPPTA